MGGGEWGFEKKKKIPTSRHNEKGFFFPPLPNQAAIQVSGEALTLAYTSKSFQWHLQLHSCFTGTLQALRTAASSKENLIPGVPSPQHIFNATTTRAGVNAGKINTGHG